MENPWSNSDWDPVRVFLAVAEGGSFSRAADNIGMSINTIRRTIERLEDQFGCKLFVREATGLRLTPEGRRIIASAREVQKSVNDLWRIAASNLDTMKGPIRLAITEGLGTFWLIPQISQFIEDTSGNNRIELQCAMKSVDVLRLEADISIQFEEPKNPDLIRRKLGTLHLVPWASAHYAERFGLPSTFVELANHRVVEQETDQLSNYDLDGLFGPGAAERMVAIKTNFSSAHYWAISKGIGIGMMPSYAKMIGGQVLPVPIKQLRFSTPIWMACHPEVLKSARHRKFADWLASCFCPEKYPWFRDEFMSPEDVEEHFRKLDLGDYFSGFVASPLDFGDDRKQQSKS